MTEDFDAHELLEFVQDLEEIGRQQRLVEAERPSATTIGEVLVRSISLTREVIEAHSHVAALQAAENSASGRHISPALESLAETDAKWLRASLSFDVPLNELGEPAHYLTHPLVDPVSSAIEFVRRFVRSAMDNLEAMGHLVASDVGFRSPAVLSRAALEACAAASYLTDARVSSSERMRRLWNLQCERLTENISRGTNESEARDQRDDVLDAAEQVGFRVKRVRPGERFRAPTILSEDGKSHSSTLEMITSTLDADVGKSMWQGLSDVAHSRSSGLMFLDEVTPRHRQIPAMRTESIAFHAMPSLIGFFHLGDHFEDYLGWRDSSWTESFEPVLTLWNAAAGGADEIIRARLGLPVD